MPAEALSAMDKVLGDVRLLVDKAQEVTGGRRGKPSEDLGYLKRPALMLCYTAWEVYVEDSLIQVAKHAAEVPSPLDLPNSMRELTADYVKSKESDPWSMAGDGWRESLTTAVTRKTRGVGDHGYGGLNTANYKGVGKLQRQILGTSLIESCRWQRKNPESIEETLDELVSVRGAIVHRGETPGTLDLKGVLERQQFVKRLGEKLDDKLELWCQDNLSSYSRDATAV